MQYSPIHYQQPKSALQPQNKPGLILKLLWEGFWFVFWMLILALIILRIFVFQQVKVNGQSMDPNYYDGQMLLINRNDQEISRGQVVAVYARKDVAAKANYFTPFDPTNVFLLKRVIGLPGESIEMIGSKVIIYNQDFPEGAILVESYLSQKVIQEMEESNFYFPKVTIEPDNYFLMGDNRKYSRDSREVGTFPKYTFFGKEVLRYWPLEESRVFQIPNYYFVKIDPETQNRLIQARLKFSNGL